MKNKLINSCLLFSVISLGAYAEDIETYVIRRGDTLNKIAKNFNISVKEILKYNKIKNPDLIYAGDTILIPYKNKEEIVEKNERKILKVEITPESYLEIYYKGELIGYKSSKDSAIIEVKDDKIEIGEELELNIYKENGELEEKRGVIEDKKKVVFVTFIDKNKNGELDIEDNLITDGEFIIDNKKIEISSSGETEIPGLEIGKKYEIIINSKGRNIVEKKVELKVEGESLFIPVENTLFSIDGKVEIESKPFFEKESEIYENLLLRIKNSEGIELFLLPIDKNGKFYIEELPRGEYLYDIEKVGETKIETIEKNKALIVNNENLTINLKIKGIFFNNY